MEESTPQLTPGIILKYWHIVVMIFAAGSSAAWFSFKLSIVEADNATQTSEIEKLQSVAPVDTEHFLQSMSEVNKQITDIKIAQEAARQEAAATKAITAETSKKIDNLQTFLINFFSNR